MDSHIKTQNSKPVAVYTISLLKTGRFYIARVSPDQKCEGHKLEKKNITQAHTKVVSPNEHTDCLSIAKHSAPPEQ